MKRFARLCRAASIAVVAWVAALQVTVSEPLHTLLLLVSLPLLSSSCRKPVPIGVGLAGMRTQLSYGDLAVLIHTNVHPFGRPQAPLLLLVAFGGYLLVLLVAGAISFRSCPKDAKALQQVGTP